MVCGMVAYHFPDAGKRRRQADTLRHWRDTCTAVTYIRRGMIVTLMDEVTQRGLHLQMGYMFRYSPGFLQVSELARTGVLGDLFAVRAHMSTNIDLVERTEQSRHRGGIMYDLGGHVLDQIVWLLGRAKRVQTLYLGTHS